MHESSLAKQILTAVLDRASTAGVSHIRAVHGWVAETEHLSAESVAFHFGVQAQGTLAQGARLDLRLVHVPARCRSCGAEYAPEHHVLSCPACGSSDGEVLGRTGLGIDSIEVRTA